MAVNIIEIFYIYNILKNIISVYQLYVKIINTALIDKDLIVPPYINLVI